LDGEEEPQVDNKDLYKKFGRENDVGKLLYGMYAQKEKPKIYYPPVKTKKRGATPKKEKVCPQQTVIEYPEMPSKSKYKFNAIDFVPRRKPGEVIIAETEYEKNKPLGRPPGKMGVNRPKKIAECQENFQFKDKAELEAYMANKRRAAQMA